MEFVSLSIKTLAATTIWEEIRRTGAVQISMAGEDKIIRLASSPTRFGRYRFFICPWGSRCRLLFFGTAGGLGCKSCLSVRHPDQLLSSSDWNRRVIRLARQIKRIDQRLLGRLRDQDRARLVRRRGDLLVRLEQALAARPSDLHDGVETLKRSWQSMLPSKL